MSKPDAIAKTVWDAAKSGDLPALQKLVRENRDCLHAQTPFGTALHLAASRGDLAMTQALLSWGADMNARGGTFKGTAINVAASEGHSDVVRILLEHGAELDTSAPERNPLFSAIYGGHEQIIEQLLLAGIDSHIAYTFSGSVEMSALEFALERGQAKSADTLRRHQASALERNG